MNNKIKISAASIEGNLHSNQDKWGKYKNYIWVIDGATKSSNKFDSEIIEFVNTFDVFLRKSIDEYESQPNSNLAEIGQNALNYLSKKIPNNESSATFAFVKIDKNIVNWLVLGDCFILEMGNQPAIRTDDRLENIAKFEREALRIERNRKNSSPVLISKLKKLLKREEDLYRNRKGGFWVLEANKNVFRNSLQGYFHISSFSIGTDGALECIDLTNQEQVTSYANKLNETKDLNSFIFEETFRKKRLKNPSSKVDDATLVRAIYG